MSKNIEMKEKLSDGSYDPLYPKTTAENTTITDAGGYFTETNVEAALQALAISNSVKEDVPFVIGKDLDTNKDILCIVKTHTFASLTGNNYNTAFSLPGTTKFTGVAMVRSFGADVVAGSQPVGSLATFAAAQGTVSRAAVELYVWGAPVATSTTWRFAVAYEL